jgi:hypothetical protein
MKTSLSLIEEFLIETEQVSESAKKFTTLNKKRLNWKPDANRWSVGEVFEHLIRTNKLYINYFEKSVPGKKSTGFFSHTFMGKIVMKVVSPYTKMRFKTAKNLNPSRSNIQESIVNDFLKQHKYLVELAGKMRNSDLKEIVTSPINSLVKYNLGDCLLIIALHDQRHLLQAERVMSEKSFPN